MSLQQIRQTILDVLKDIQTLSGRPWTELPPTAKPLCDLQGFDSICSVEATVLVEERLGGRKLKPYSVFISEDGQRALSIDEAAEHIQLQLTAQPEQEAT